MQEGAIRLRYDEKADALYVRLDESDVVESEEIKPQGGPLQQLKVLVA
jgi:hypothetical protein